MRFRDCPGQWSHVDSDCEILLLTTLLYLKIFPGLGPVLEWGPMEGGAPEVTEITLSGEGKCGKSGNSVGEGERLTNYYGA